MTFKEVGSERVDELRVHHYVSLVTPKRERVLCEIHLHDDERISPTLLMLAPTTAIKNTVS